MDKGAKYFMEYIPDNSTPILIVDDDTGFLKTVRIILENAGMPEPALLSDSTKVIELLEKHRFQFVMLDMIMPSVDGMEILKKIQAEHFNVECVIVTAVKEISQAVKAMQFGAYDYLVKPVSADKLVISIKRALERWHLRHGLSLYAKKQTFSNLKNPQAFSCIVAEDHAMARVFHQIEIVAPTDYSVVITGESGTGKELVARSIHHLSSRSEHSFVPVNMGSVTKNLFQDEFFGHEKGAYTGAVKTKQGFLEKASNGTLFMDEITDLDISGQGALLRVLQENEYYRLGSTKTMSTNVRLIAASNRNIEQEIKNNSFRADLFHRINMFHINIPPLRDRKNDIIPISNHFLKIFSRENRKNIKGLSSELSSYLLSYDFPGNVRELKNIIARAVLTEGRSYLSMDSIFIPDTQRGNIKDFRARKEDESPLKSLAEMEQVYIQKVLEHVNHNRTHAAKILGIGRRTLQRKLKKQIFH